MKSTNSQPTISTLPSHYYNISSNLPQFFQLTLYDGLYHGQLKNSLKHGMGIFLWNNGDSYYGEWHNNQIHGRGLFCFSSGIYIEGSFNKGQLNGAASIYYPDDSFLKGAFAQGKLMGRILAYDAMQEAWYLQDYKSGGGINTLYEGKGKPMAYDYLRDIQVDALKDIGLLSKVDKEFQCVKKDMMSTLPLSCIGCFETGPGERHYGFLKDRKVAGLGIRISSKEIEMGRYQEGELNGSGQRIEFGKTLYRGYFLDGAFNGEGVLYEWTTKKKYEGSFSQGDLMKKKSETIFEPKELEVKNPMEVPVNPAETETIANLGLRDFERAFKISNEPEPVPDSPAYRPTIKDILSTAKKLCRETIISSEEIPSEESERFLKQNRSKNPSVNIKDLTFAMQRSPENIDKALDFSNICINHLSQKLDNYQNLTRPTQTAEENIEERPFARAFSIEINSSRSVLPQRAKSRDTLVSSVTLQLNNPSNSEPFDMRANDLRGSKELRKSKELRRSKDKENSGVRLSTVELDLTDKGNYAPVRANTEMFHTEISNSTNEQYIASLLKEANTGNSTQKNRSPLTREAPRSATLKKSNSHLTVNKISKSPSAQLGHLVPSPSVASVTLSRKNHGLSFASNKTAKNQPNTLTRGSFMQSCEVVPPTRKLRTSIPSFSSSKVGNKNKESTASGKSQFQIGPHKVQVKTLKQGFEIERLRTEPLSTQEDTGLLYKQTTCESPQESPLEYVKPYVKTTTTEETINEMVISKSAQFQSGFESGSTQKQMMKPSQVPGMLYPRMDSMNLSISRLGKDLSSKEAIEGKDNTLENIDHMESVVIDPNENSGDFQGSLHKLSSQEIERVMEKKLSVMEKEGLTLYWHRGSKEDIKRRVETEGNKESRAMVHGMRSMSQSRKRSEVEKSPIMKTLSQLRYRKSVYTVEEPEKKPPISAGKLGVSKSSKSIERGGSKERKGSLIDSAEKPKHLKGTRSMNSFHRAKSSFVTEGSSSLYNIKLDGFDSRKPSVTGQKSGQQGGQSVQRVTRNPSIDGKVVQKAPYFMLDLSSQGMRKENSMIQKTPSKTPLSSSRRTSHRHRTEGDEGGYPVKRTCDPKVDCHYYETSDNSTGRGRSLSSGRHRVQTSTRNRSAGETRDSMPSSSARSGRREEVKVITSFIKEEKEPDVVPLDDLVNQYKQQMNTCHNYNYSHTEFEVRMSYPESQIQARGLPTDRNRDEYENEVLVLDCRYPDDSSHLNNFNNNNRDAFLKRNGVVAGSHSITNLSYSDTNHNSGNYNSQKRGLQSSTSQYASNKQRQPSIKIEESPLSIQISETPKSLKALSSKGSSLKQQISGSREVWASPKPWRSPTTSSVLSRSSVEDFETWKKGVKVPKKKSLTSFEDNVLRNSGVSVYSSFENKQDRKEYAPKGKWAHDRAKSGSAQVIYEVEEEKGVIEKEGEHTRKASSTSQLKASSTQFRASQISDLVSEVSEVPEERPSKYAEILGDEEVWKFRQMGTLEGDVEPVDNSLSYYDMRMRGSEMGAGKGFKKRDK